MNESKKVLFVCVENSNRSQMAEAFAKIIGGDAVEAFSAGSKPSGVINPKAIAAMEELGYDLSQHSSTGLNSLPELQFDYVATMGCGDSTAEIDAKQHVDWAIPDPKHLPPEEFRQIRDSIRRRVANVLSELGAL